ncbi:MULTISPECIES: hypothetical protein [Priestia]|uniref:hypothetical protein n=1 Tax=Priestia TaxID=2800373 RepID=UPI00210E4D01|nr:MULTISPECIES: hypothetical protein [Priestia]MED4098394.1 hypothetical protein [Priestia megaterium]
MRMVELNDYDLAELSLFSTPEEVKEKITDRLKAAGFDLDVAITKIRDDKLKTTVYMQETTAGEDLENTLNYIQSFYDRRD